MKYATAAAFRAALEQRLRTRSRESGSPIIRLRKLVVFDRLLARLRVVAPQRWMLKGAVALLYRTGPEFRTTLDIDLARDEDEPRAIADFLSVQSLDLGDYFSFAIERARRLDAAVEGASVRFRAQAEVAGRLFEDVAVDVIFGEPHEEAPEVLRGPELLGFADIVPVEFLVLPLAVHVAEKVHAYTRTYAGGRPSTRMKDLVDLVMVASAFPFEASALRRALYATFDSRRSHGLATGLPPPPPDWRLPYRRLAREAGIKDEVTAGYELARRFLDPLLTGSCPDTSNWDPHSHKWR